MRGSSCPRMQIQAFLPTSLGTPYLPSGNGDLPQRKLTQVQPFPPTSSLNAPLPSSDGDRFQLNLATCTKLLRSCTYLKTLIPGLILHDHAIKCGHHHMPHVATLILDLYLTCGAFTDALRWFACMPVRNVLSWNLIIRTFVHRSDFSEALKHYRCMQQHGLRADQVTYVQTLSACTTMEEGLVLHADIRASGFYSDTMVGTALVSMFGRLHSVEDAHSAFSRIVAPNIISWNAMMTACIQNGQDCKILFLFYQSQQEGLLPAKVTFLNALTAHPGNQECHGECKRLHVQVLYGVFTSDNVVGTALIYAYGKCNHLDAATAFFQAMQVRSVVSWNTMISLYAQERHFGDACATFHQMQVEGIVPDNVTFIALLDMCARPMEFTHGKQMHVIMQHCALKPDVILNTALINLYGKCGKLPTAFCLFFKMKDRNVIAWNTIISAYTQHGFGTDALQFFRQMQHEAITPNKFTLIEVFSACACQAALTIGKNVHSCMVQSSIEMDNEVGSSLISMYGKCGSAKYTQAVFDNLPFHKRSAWNALIATHAQLGDAKEAIRMLEKMEVEGVLADDITFVSILAACSRCGMLAEGFHYFVCICEVYGLTHTEEHFDCMIDLLCRAGLFNHAAYVMRNMPKGPTIISWTSLLCAYAIGVEGC